jgi:hypothetical protein
MCQSIEYYPIIIDVMIYVLFVNPFIRGDRDMTLYFKITHFGVMRFASSVILFN